MRARVGNVTNLAHMSGVMYVWDLHSLEFAVTFRGLSSFEIRTRNEDLHWVVVEHFFLETPEQDQREGEGKYLPLSYNDGGNLWTIRPHSVCSWLSCSSLFLIADGGRPSGSTAVYDGCVCDYTTYSIYKYATTTSDHVNFWFFIFLTTHDIVIEIIVFTLAKFPTRWRLLREVDNDVLLSPWTPLAVWNWLGLLFLFLQFYQKSSNRLLLVICDLVITCISVGWESARSAHTLLPVIGLGGYPRAY